MLIGYMRTGRADTSQLQDVQREALCSAGIMPDRLYRDHVSAKGDDCPGLDMCLGALQAGDILVAWKLDRLGRDLRHLIDLMHQLALRNVGLKVLSGEAANIDTTAGNGRLLLSFFAALAEFERELMAERARTALVARARRRSSGRPFKMTPAKLRRAQAAMGEPDTKVAALCVELGVTRQTLYRHVDPTGRLRPDGAKLLAPRRSGACASANEACESHFSNA